MEYTSLDRLSAFMRRKTDRKGALVIGYDGTAALLGHDDHLSMRDHLAGDNYADQLHEDISREVADGSDLDSPYEFVKRITKRANGSALAAAAVQSIAALLKAGYLGAVVATDPDMLLYIALRDCGVAGLRHVAADGSSREFINAAFSSRAQDGLFIDGGGTLIAGYREGLERSSNRLFTPHAEHVRGLPGSIAQYFAGFEDLYCWGWCGANVPFHWMYDDGHKPVIHSIGPRNECGPPRTNQIRHYGPRGDGRDAADWEGGAWLTRLADRLELRVSAPAANGSAPADSLRPLRHVRSPLIRPQLSDEVLEDLTVDVPGREIKVIGVESRHVRQSVAVWLAHQSAATGRMTVLREDENLARLVRNITATIGRASESFVVGCYTGSARPGDPAWSSLVTLAIERWMRDVRPRPGFRLVFFCPPEISRWTSRVWRTRGVWVESHSNWKPAVESWLRESIDALGRSASPADLRRFVGIIEEPPDPERAVPPESVAEALETWLLDISGSPSARSDGKELSLQEIVDAWDLVVDMYLDVTRGISVDGSAEAEDFAPNPTRREEELDFDLGPIVRRTVAEPFETPGAEGGSDDS